MCADLLTFLSPFPYLSRLVGFEISSPLSRALVVYLWQLLLRALTYPMDTSQTYYDTEGDSILDHLNYDLSLKLYSNDLEWLFVKLSPNDRVVTLGSKFSPEV